MIWLHEYIVGIQETIRNCQNSWQFWVSDWLSSPRYFWDSVWKEKSMDLCHLLEFPVTSSWALFKTSFRISDICKLICTNTYIFLISFHLHSELDFFFFWRLFISWESWRSISSRVGRQKQWRGVIRYRQIATDNIYMWNLKNDINELIYKTEIDSQIQKTYSFRKG